MSNILIDLIDHNFEENSALKINKGKDPIVKSGEDKYLCYAIETHVITKDDDLKDIVKDYIKPVFKKGDIIFFSEKMVACTQNRAIPLVDINAGFWAKLLSKYVTKTPAGIGLGMPETMQCAIDECGLIKIFAAAAASLVGKTFGFDGWFYKVAGPKAAGIDGPCSWTIFPYNKCVVLTPESPSEISNQISQDFDTPVAIVDLNDLGGEILGKSANAPDDKVLLDLLSQNPLGQARQSTPIGILRPLNKLG